VSGRGRSPRPARTGCALRTRVVYAGIFAKPAVAGLQLYARAQQRRCAAC
jgi:hypothetical protein